MKKILLIVLLFLAGISSVFADELEDDYLDIASNYCVEGDYNSAMEYLNKILARNPNNTKVADLKKGLTHVISKDKKSFIDSVNPALRQAMEYKRLGDETSEYNSLVAATKENNAYLAYYYLGNFYREKFDYKKAIDSYNASVSARADFAPAYLSTGVVLYELGKYNAALNPIDKYLTFNPEDDYAYSLKSRAEFQLGMIEKSKIDNNKAIILNNSPEYQFDRAKILYKEGDYLAAKNLFTNLLSYIQTSKIYEYLGLCDYAMQNYSGALINYDKAIILSDDDEYLESRYNEIKGLLEKQQNEKVQEE
ncbi:hypothetical protein IJ579_05300 [bacterium]|nr:hypothetical protein [bacterium]